MNVLMKKEPPANISNAEGPEQCKGNAIQDSLLVQSLPAGFTACKHASNRGNDETDGSNTSHN